MYHYVVRRNLRNTFANVNAGNYGAVLSQFAPSGAVHWFSGSHAFGGGRDDRQQIEEWYDRLATVLPDLRFEIKNIAVRGWPWNTVAMVEWVDHLSDRDGTQYTNEGVHVIKIKWAKVTELRIYCDTQKFAGICQAIGAQGVPEAVAPAIGDAAPFAQQAGV